MSQFDEFKPEIVEEQIAQFAQDEKETSPGARVVQDLQDFYAFDASMIDRVWQRLERARQESANQQESYSEARYEGISPKQMRVAEAGTAYIPLTTPLREKKHFAPRRFFALLASVIVSILVIGSVASFLSLLKQSPDQPGGTGSPTRVQHPSPTAQNVVKPDPAGIYLVDVLGVRRLDKTSGKQLWFYDIKADPNTKPSATHFVTSPLLLSNGVVYFGGNDFESTQYNSFYLYALNAATGKLLWREAVNDEVTTLVKDEHGIIYAGIGGDAGYAFNSDGSLRWFRAFSNDPSSPRQLIQVEQNVLYAERNQTISALSTQDGQQIWSKTTLSGGFIGGISVANGVVYVTSYVLASDPQAESTSYVEAYRATDGALVWQSQPLNQSLFAAPVVANGLVYVGSPNSQIYALNVENGQVKWRQNAGHSVFAPPYISGRILVIGTSGVEDAHIIAYNAVTGTQKWSHPSFSFDGPSNEHMFVSANRVYYGLNGSIHVLNLANGQQIATFTAGSGTDTRFTVVE